MQMIHKIYAFINPIAYADSSLGCFNFGCGCLVTLALFSLIAYNVLFNFAKQLQIIFRTAMFTCPCANYVLSTFNGPCSVSNAPLRNGPRLVNCVIIVPESRFSANSLYGRSMSSASKCLCMQLSGFVIIIIWSVLRIGCSQQTTTSSYLLN